MLGIISSSGLKSFVTLRWDFFHALIRFTSHSRLVTTDVSFDQDSIDRNLDTIGKDNEVTDHNFSRVVSILLRYTMLINTNDINLLSIFSLISLSNELGFLSVINNGTDSGHDQNGHHNSKTINPSVIYVMTLGSAHIDGDTYNSTDHKEFEHVIVQSAIEHGAAGVSFHGVTSVVTKRCIAL